MSRGPRLTATKKIEIAALEKHGMSRSAIARQLGISPSCVTRVLGSRTRQDAPQATQAVEPVPEVA